MLMATTTPAATTAANFENDLISALSIIMTPERAKKAIADGKTYASVEVQKAVTKKLGPVAIALGAVSATALILSVTAMFFPRRVR